jgi:hypothetical protein
MIAAAGWRQAESAWRGLFASVSWLYQRYPRSVLFINILVFDSCLALAIVAWVRGEFVTSLLAGLVMLLNVAVLGVIRTIDPR